MSHFQHILIVVEFDCISAIFLLRRNYALMFEFYKNAPNKLPNVQNDELCDASGDAIIAIAGYKIQPQKKQPRRVALYFFLLFLIN